MGDRAVAEVEAFPLAVLGDVEHLVVAEGIAALHEGPLLVGPLLRLAKLHMVGQVKVGLIRLVHHLLHLLLFYRERVGRQDLIHRK